MTATADATDSSTVEQLIATVEDLRDTVEQQAERITELETELAQTKDHTGREFADIRARITDVEERNQATEVPSGDATPGVEAAKTGPQNAKTPLERICALPEHVADRELTANQERARFIARDVRDYAEKAPAGLVIDSRAIKRVLTASEGKRPHTQTVARVMSFLDELGKEDVQQKKRRGKKFVVVDPEAADRLADHDRCDGGSDPTHPERVISSG
jgi:cell division septum initiation protein DivIVA